MQEVAVSGELTLYFKQYCGIYARKNSNFATWQEENILQKDEGNTSVDYFQGEDQASSVAQRGLLQLVDFATKIRFDFLVQFDIISTTTQNLGLPQASWNFRSFFI